MGLATEYSVPTFLPSPLNILVPGRSTRGDQAAVCVHTDTQSSGFGSDETHFALQTEVECRQVQVALAYPCRRSSPQSPYEPGFAVHACGGACDGGQERDAVIVNV